VVVGAAAAAGSDGVSGCRFRWWCRCLRSMDGILAGIYLLCDGEDDGLCEESLWWEEDINGDGGKMIHIFL